MSDQNLAQVISGAIPGSANERRYLHTRLSKLASEAEHGGAAGNEALALATALCEVLGIYSNALTLSPQAAQTGKKITVEGEIVDAEGLVITAPLEVQQGIVYTIPASDSYADGTAIVAKVVTEDGQTTYVPLMWPITADPLTGKYSFLATETTDVVFTMFESNVGGSISGVYSDIFFQIASALTGYVTKTGEELLVIAAALADVFTDVQNLAARNQFGSIKIVDATFENVPRVNGFPMVVHGAGAPSAATLPRQSGLPAFIGQHYIDTSNTKEYSSKGTESISDWFLLN